MSVPYNFASEHSTIEGLCFFEILSTYLKTVKGSEQFSVKKLKEDCIKYSKENEWVKKGVLERAEKFYKNDKNYGEIWKVYMLAMQYDAQEMSKMAISESKVEQIVYNTLIKDEFRNACLDAVCGQLEIEGRILCEIYGIKILLVNDDDKLPTTHCDTVYLVKRGLNHYERLMEKKKSDDKSAEEHPSTSASDYVNFNETNNQDASASNFINFLQSKFTTKTKTQISKCAEETNKIFWNLNAESFSDSDDTDSSNNLNELVKYGAKQSKKKNKNNFPEDASKMVNASGASRTKEQGRKKRQKYKNQRGEYNV